MSSNIHSLFEKRRLTSPRKFQQLPTSNHDGRHKPKVLLLRLKPKVCCMAPKKYLTESRP